MIEDIALNYFRGLGKAEKKQLIKRIFDSLSEAEKLDIAKLIVGKK
ncbi:MAG: hypothetical protein HOE11_02560 [Candidatus Diapherotrites archaeon]|jgi:hypothetical protein|nr:hypothetical protein [Candidatus Diapherotrites archaeon]MBT4596720.1 hypothetical protein [Candidatus Diapherotrites archaeon]